MDQANPILLALLLGVFISILITISLVIYPLKFTNKKRTYKLTSSHPKKYIVFCSDTRFFRALILFIVGKKGLNLKWGSFFARNEAGGPAPFAYENEMPRRFRYLKRQLVFALEHFPHLDEIILFGHQDCKYYGIIENPDEATDREFSDLPDIADAVREITREHGKEGIKITTYYARIVGEKKDQIEFDKVSTREELVSPY